MDNKQSIQIAITTDISKMTSGFKAAQAEIKRLTDESKRSSQQIANTFSSVRNMAAGALAGGAALYYANQVRQIADEYTNLAARIKLTVDSNEEFAVVQQRLYEISQQTGTEYASNADSYAKLSRSLKDVGASSQETLNITEMVNKSLIVNGSSTAMAGSFMLQFAQAMGSGVMQGDEFRAVLESNGYFAGLLAKALGTDIAGLRKMSKEGKLTTDVLRNAFPKVADEINSAFAKLPVTTGRAMTMLENSFKRIIDDSNKASDGTGTIAKSIVDLATTIDTNREGIISLFSSIISMTASTVKALANIGQSMAGWSAVSQGSLSFFEFATMNAEELNAWLKKNTAEMRTIDAQISALVEKRRAIADQGSYSSDGIKAQGQEIAAINKQIEALKQQKAEIAGVGAAHKPASLSMSENATSSYGKITDAARKSADDQKAATGKALEEMKGKYKEYAAEVRRLQGEIVNEERSTADQLRNLARQGMSEPDAWEDKKRQAQEYQAAAVSATQAAKAALAQGDQESAKDYFKQAADNAEKSKQYFADLGTEVKENDQVIISQTEALKTAMDGVASASQTKIDAIRAMQSAAEKNMTDLEKKFGLDALQDGIDEAEKKWLKNWQSMREQAVDDIEKVEDRLIAIKDKEVTVWINEKTRKREGGPVGLRRGGSIPGYGGGDRVPALLERGEYVIRKEAVSHYGVGFFNRLNAMLAAGSLDKIARFAAGGQVGGGSAANPVRHEHVIRIGGGSATVFSDDLNAKKLTGMLERAARMSS